jgi:hypothetical protein
LRVRRELRSISQEEKKAFFDAILELKRIFVYEFFVTAHGAGSECFPFPFPFPFQCAIFLLLHLIHEISNPKSKLNPKKKKIFFF